VTADFAAVAAVLEKELSPNRFRHSLAVARFAADLARRHGWDAARARMAGLVHDCAKEWSPAKLKAHVKRRRLIVPGLAFILKTSPGLLHAYVGADVAREKGWISGEQVRAVAGHTLGAEKMGAPEMILFVADLASPDRAFRDAARIRRIARKDLRAALREALAVKLGHQLRKSQKIHPTPVRVWNALLEKKR
jgi:predicted HD superfamily hydrolase involved in NAD metabolism